MCGAQKRLSSVNRCVYSSSPSRGLSSLTVWVACSFVTSAFWYNRDSCQLASYLVCVCVCLCVDVVIDGCCSFQLSTSYEEDRVKGCVHWTQFQDLCFVGMLSDCVSSRGEWLGGGLARKPLVKKLETSELMINGLRGKLKIFSGQPFGSKVTFCWYGHDSRGQK